MKGRLDGLATRARQRAASSTPVADIVASLRTELDAIGSRAGGQTEGTFLDRLRSSLLDSDSLDSIPEPTALRTPF